MEGFSEVACGFASPQAQPVRLIGVLSRCSHPGLLARVPEEIYPAGQWPRNHHFVGNPRMDDNGAGSLCQALIACRQVHEEDAALENVQHSPAAGRQGVFSLQGVRNGLPWKLGLPPAGTNPGGMRSTFMLLPKSTAPAKVAVSKRETCSPRRACMRRSQMRRIRIDCTDMKGLEEYHKCSISRGEGAES